MDTGIRVVRGLLALLFVSGGATKLIGTGGTVEGFASLGGDVMRHVVGSAELLGGLGLLLPPTVLPAAVGLALLMVGAIASHLTVLGGSPLPAAVVLVLCLTVAWARRADVAAIRVILTTKGPMDGWLAGAYDRGVQTAFRDVFPELAGDLLATLTGARRLLDAGCGPGQFTIIAAERLPQTQIDGIDLAPAMIAIAKKRAAASPAASRLRFQVADVARLPFADGTFDAVMSTGSIKHWPDAVAGLRELHRVLAPGGLAFVAEINREAPPSAVAAQAARMSTWLFRRLYPRVVRDGLTPEAARAAFAASPFGPPTGERMLLDGCLWLLEGRKAAARAAG
jgi:ubiquinone/menaquinone biosynthesis C-methylase UbiE